MPDETKMVAYIGTKIVCAVPMSKHVFMNGKNPPEAIPAEEAGKDRVGYSVVYPDGYESWSPKEVFEAAYRLVSDDERRMI